MDHPVKICRDCSKYKPYYTKEYCTFAKMPAGLCVFHKKTVGALSFCDDWSDERRSPEEILEQALAVLPPKCKEVFLMAKLKGMKYREIAESLQISEKTVDNQMTKVIRQLREFVSGTPLSLMAFIVLVLTFIFNCD